MTIIVLIVVVGFVVHQTWKKRTFNLIYTQCEPKLLFTDDSSTDDIQSNGYNGDVYNNGYILKFDPDDGIDLTDNVEVEGSMIGATRLGDNQAIVIYGILPYRYAYWSIDAYQYSIPHGARHERKMQNLGGTISSATVTGQSNDMFVVIVTKNRAMYDYVSKKMYDEINENNSGYHIYIYPIFIMPEVIVPGAKYCVISRFLLRNPKEYIPQWKHRLYTSDDIYFTRPFISKTTPKKDVMNEQRVVSPSLWITVPSQYYEKQGIFDYIQHPVSQSKHVKEYSGNITYIESGVIETHVGDVIEVFSIDHGTSHKALVSTITIQDVTTGKTIYTNMTGDYQTRRTPVKDSLRSIISVCTPGSRKIKVTERIYCDIATGVAPDISTIHHMQVFHRQIDDK